MFRYLKMVPVVALAGTLGLFWSPDAEAQTASDLNCKKCVGTGDIAKNAVTGSRLKNKAVTRRKINKGAVSQSKLGFDPATQAELDRLQDQVDALALDLGDVLNRLLPKTVFVNSDQFMGNLGGLAGADAICQAAADDPAAVVPAGEYVAWLSTDTVDARDRITQTLGVYVRSDGVVVAKSYADLINAANVPLLSPIGRDEFANLVTDAIWTGTSSTGIGDPSSHCSGWTKAGTTDRGTIGAPIRMDGGWTLAFRQSCENSQHLYCFQK